MPFSKDCSGTGRGRALEETGQPGRMDCKRPVCEQARVNVQVEVVHVSVDLACVG